MLLVAVLQRPATSHTTPLHVTHNRAHPRARAEFDKLDYGHLLPIFFDGLREEEQPFKFIAQQGAHDLLKHGGPRILPILSRLIMPLKNAFITRRPAVVLAGLEALKQLTTCDLHLGAGPMIARALVPYYRQLIPTLYIFYRHHRSTGDRIDYGQRKNNVLGDRIEEVSA